MQLRMSPTGGMPSSVAQDPGRPAVVGHGHDRREVAGVLLETAQQDRQARPATDRDDARAAGEEALLVDELDQRLVWIGCPQRVCQDVDGLVRPERHERDADRGGDQPAQPERQELQRQQVDQAADEPGRRIVPGDLAEEMGERHRQQQEPGEDDQEPALDPDAGGQPAPEVHAPVELPVEDRDRAEVLVAQPAGELLGDDDRAVIAAGAADRDGQARLALGDVGRDRELEELDEEVEEACRDRLAEHEGPDLVGQPGERPQLGDVERVLHEADVEDEVGLERHAVLEAEADELERELVGPDIGRQGSEESLAQLAQRQVGGVEDDVGVGADGVEPAALLGDRVGDAALVPERMAVAGLAEAADQDVVARLEEDHPGPDATALERAAHRRKRERRVAGSDVEDDGHAREPGPVGRDQLREVGQQLAGQVVDDRVAEVLEELRGGRLAAAGQAADDDDRRLGHGVGRRPRVVRRGSPSAALDEQDGQLVQDVHRAAEDERADEVTARAWRPQRRPRCRGSPSGARTTAVARSRSRPATGRPAGSGTPSPARTPGTGS